LKNILVVCLGNICRSPLAEGILLNKIKQNNLKDIYIDSAGTAAYHIGENPDKRSIANAKKHGIDISKFVARQFVVKDFDAFDKIFVMDTSNFADVLALARNDGDRNKVDLILNTIYPKQNNSVPDPYFGREEGFENVYLMLDRACDAVLKGDI